MRRPRRPQQVTHRPRTLVPASAPELFFRGDQAEPPEVVAFRDALNHDPVKVRQALEAHRTSRDGVSEDDVLAGVVRDIISSKHWSGKPAGLAVDRTTEDRFVAANHSTFETFGNMGQDHPNYTPTQLSLRAGMLATLATRAADAGVIYKAPGYM